MKTRSEQIADYERRLQIYLDAETAILGGSQSYSIGNRSMTLADLETIQKWIDRLESKIRIMTGGNKIGVHRVVPRDNV